MPYKEKRVLILFDDAIIVYRGAGNHERYHLYEAVSAASMKRAARLIDTAPERPGDRFGLWPEVRAQVNPMACPQCGSADFRLMRLETNIVEHLIDDEGYVDFSEYLKVYPDDTLDHWLHCNVCGEDFEPVTEPRGETGYTEAADRVVGVGDKRDHDFDWSII